MADAPMTLDKLRELRDEYYRHISLAPSPGYADDRMHTALTYAVAEIESAKAEPPIGTLAQARAARLEEAIQRYLIETATVDCYPDAPRHALRAALAAAPQPRETPALRYKR